MIRISCRNEQWYRVDMIETEIDYLSTSEQENIDNLIKSDGFIILINDIDELCRIPFIDDIIMIE